MLYTVEMLYQKQSNTSKMRYILLSVLAVSLVGILMAPVVSSQQATIPTWIKNNAMWWASDQIPDSAFLQGIQFLIKEGIMVIPSTETSESSQSQEVPTWIKNTAGWWAEDKISEVEFVNAIQYLVKHKIITVNDGSSCANDLSEMFGDSNAIVQDICDLHESSEYSELVPFIGKSNLNSLGFRGPEFSEIKPSNTYRIFMVGGSTLFGSGESSDETTIPGILQKMFDIQHLDQNVEVINTGFSGGNSNTELNLIVEKLLLYKPDLVIIYDGWNDLSTDTPVLKIKNTWKNECELGEIHDFDVIISLQPIAGFGEKVLTEQEKINSLTGQDHNGFQLLQAESTYDYMARELLSLNDCDVYDLRGIFDDVSGPIYWDQVHTADAGNLILAEKFLKLSSKKVGSDISHDNKFHKIISNYNNPKIISYLLSKINIDVDYKKVMNREKGDMPDKKGNYFYLKNTLGGTENILVGKDLRDADLSSMNLNGQDLTGANLSGQDLRNVDLSNTILRGADLSYSNLEGKNFQGQDIRGVNFCNANLKNVDLRDAILSKTINVFNFGKCMEGEILASLMLNHYNCIKEVVINESIRTDFSNAKMNGVKIGKLNQEKHQKFFFANFSNTDLTGMQAFGVGFFGCDFNNGLLENTNVKKADIVQSDFINAKMSNVSMEQIWFQFVSFEDAIMTDSIIDDSSFIDVSLANTNLERTKITIKSFGTNNFNCKNNSICN